MSGISVSLSGNGSVLAVGGYGDNYGKYKNLLALETPCYLVPHLTSTSSIVIIIIISICIFHPYYCELS